MSLPAASAPVAVLVLAWDEISPAARVLVEASALAEPAPDSVAVLVSSGLDTDELTQEEFLPLEISPMTPEPVPGLPAETLTSSPIADSSNNQKLETSASEDTSSSAENSDLATPTASNRIATSLLAEESSATTTAASTPPLPIAEAATAAALTKPALVWQEVRVLRQGSYASYAVAARPTLVWEGVPAVPAVPYLGSAEVPSQPAQRLLAAGTSAVAATLQGATGSAASAIRVLRGVELPSTGPALAPDNLPAFAPAPTYLRTEQAAAPDAESDATPLPTADETALTTEASTTEQSEAADATDAFTVDTSPVQTESIQLVPLVAGATETTLPASEAEFFSTAGLDMPPGLAALRPTGQAFEAPNLNFQIIQYARQAVPQALAKQPFGVIYAPAWPTWLAAQELRHRSGQPLVLHIAKLAAADDEPLDLAAGWVAEIQRQALHRADLILTETAALAQRLRHELALPAHRVRTVPATDAAAVAQALRTAVRV
jgi:hypothetical protein